MDTKNFKAEYWSKYIQTELQKDLVISNWCDYKFDKEFKKGDRLKIYGVNAPLVQTYTGADLSEEKISDNSQFLDITRADAFLIKVDIDEREEAIPEIITKAIIEGKNALAVAQDKFVAEQAKGCLSSMKSSSTDISAETSPLDTIDTALIKLYKNDVPNTTELAADLNPEHAVAVKNKLANTFTNNVEYIKRSAFGQYGNIYLRMTNNLYNDGTDDWEMIRTKNAIAVANRAKVYKPAEQPKGFNTYYKALNIYGAKLVRPKELAVIRAH